MLERMRGGDDSALAFFMRRYMDMLYCRALAIVHDKMVAEDVVQEAFIRFWDRRRELTGGDAAPAYLTRLVRNACVNHLEFQEVRRRHAAPYSAYREQEAAWPDWDEERLERVRRQLMAFIETLPGRCREVFVLACVEGLTYREVAARLDVSVNTVKTQVKTAYARVKEHFNLSDEELILFLLLSAHFS